MDPVEVERGDGVEEDGGGGVRLTCNELKKLSIFRKRPQTQGVFLAIDSILKYIDGS